MGELITCVECIERLRVIGDPRIRSGKYNMCSCDYCSKPTYYREIEAEKKPQVVEHIHRHSEMSRADFDALRQVILKVDYLEKRLNERKPGKKTTKYTIRS